MKTRLLASAALFVLALPTLASGQTAAPNPTVDFTLTGKQDSLRDPNKSDVFDITLQDAQVRSKLTVTCQAGTSRFAGFVRRDEACAVGGSGLLFNPTNPSQTIPRTQYNGGFTIQSKQDGFTDFGTVNVSYLAVGTVPASQASFDGSVQMLPENPAPSANSLKERFLSQLQTEQNLVNIVAAVDTIRLDGLRTPSAGFPSDPGCAWTGDLIYAYANDSWLIDISAVCGPNTVKLQGNMPWLEVEGQTHQAEYLINLAVPASGAASDDALFTGSDSALFAQSDGVQGTLKITQSGLVNVEIEEGVHDDVATQVSATGTLTGTGVSLETVRSFSTILALLSRAFFGA